MYTHLSLSISLSFYISLYIYIYIYIHTHTHVNSGGLRGAPCHQRAAPGPRLATPTHGY